MASVIAAIGGDFVRVRIGVGRPPAGVEAVDFVLAPLGAAERSVLDAALSRAADAIEMLAREGLGAAMRAANGAPAA